jgi:hypothetical protein
MYAEDRMVYRNIVEYSSPDECSKLLEPRKNTKQGVLEGGQMDGDTYIQSKNTERNKFEEREK